jgi:hypothetical protein
MRPLPHTGFDIRQIMDGEVFRGGISPQLRSLLLLILFTKQCAARLLISIKAYQWTMRILLHNRALDTNARWMKR